MVSVAIVENDAPDQERLKAYTERFSQENDQTVKVAVFANGLDFLKNYRAIYDVVFMDIEMPYLNGMDTARRLREVDQAVSIIFVTNMAQYAVQGYSVDALDYIVKPITYNNFCLKMKKAMRIQRLRENKYVDIQTSNSYYRLLVSDILYMESEGHYIRIHTAKEDYLVRSTMREMEEQMRPFYFARCNNSFLINIAAIQAVKTTVKVDDREISIGRKWRDSFMNAVISYFGK